MEDYKRQCERLTEQLKHSESQKAEQEQAARALIEAIEKARVFFDAPSNQPQETNTAKALAAPVAQRTYHNATAAEFHPQNSPISATRGGQQVSMAFDRFVSQHHSSMPTAHFPPPALANKHGVPTNHQPRPMVKGGPISASRGGQDVNSAFGRFMQQLGQSEASAAITSQISTPGAARLNPATAPFTPSPTASQRQSQDVLAPAQPIFVRPAKKPVNVMSPLPQPSTPGSLTAAKLGSSVAGVDASQSPPISQDIPPALPSTPHHGVPQSPQAQEPTTASLRAWFDQLLKKNSATPSAKQLPAESDELMTFSSPNSPEGAFGANKKDVSMKKIQTNTIKQASAPSARDIFSQMPADVRAAIKRVQEKASSTPAVKAQSPKAKPMTSLAPTRAQQEDKDMAAAFGELQAHWSKARWPNSPKGKENVRSAHGPTIPGSGKLVQVAAKDDLTPTASQEFREPAPLVPYASSEDSFDTRDSSKASSSDHESHDPGIGGSHVLGRYLEPDVRAMVLRGGQASIQSPNDPLTAAQLKYMEVDRLGNKWQKINGFGASGRQKSGWVISKFHDPITFDPHGKA
ncbi:MAG: hypothetical protein OHK93_002155 [Ramalina farinacea]|uniref:Uncharacterized protein n=1 Tax=Ramalina farinacea TaxID=258253 RepID=A0AA43TYF6_9LECA|nr:hypothetical protein [Ramalina farinacea]